MNHNSEPNFLTKVSKRSLELFKNPVIFGVITSVFTLGLICHLRDLLTNYQNLVSGGSDQLAFRLWTFIPLAALPFFAATGFYSKAHRNWAVAAAMALGCILSVAPYEVQVFTLAVETAFVIYVWISKSEYRQQVLIGVCLTALLCLWGVNRELMLIALSRQPLDPDAQGYLTIASKAFGYNTEYREPMFIWMIQLASLLTGGDYSWPAGRLYGVLFSMIAFVAVFGYCLRWFGLIVACVTCIFYSLNYELCMDAARLLREDSIIAAFFLFIWMWLATCNKIFNFKNYFILAISGTPMLLLRLNSLYFLIAAIGLLFIFHWYRKDAKLKHCWIPAVSLLILVMTVFPYWVYSQQKYGNWQYLEGLQMRFYANLEFAGKRPEFPTMKQVQLDGYAGGPMKTAHYLIGLHTPQELAQGMWEGISRLYGRAFDGPPYFFIINSEIEKPNFKLWHWIGAFAYLLSWKRFASGLLLFLFHAPSFFLVKFVYFDSRLVTLAFVGFYIGMGLSVLTAYEWGRKFLQEALVEPTVATDSHAKHSSKRKFKGR